MRPAQLRWQGGRVWEPAPIRRLASGTERGRTRLRLDFAPRLIAECDFALAWARQASITDDPEHPDQVPCPSTPRTLSRSSGQDLLPVAAARLAAPAVLFDNLCSGQPAANAGLESRHAATLG